MGDIFKSFWRFRPSTLTNPPYEPGMTTGLGAWLEEQRELYRRGELRPMREKRCVMLTPQSMLSKLSKKFGTCRLCSETSRLERRIHVSRGNSIFADGSRTESLSKREWGVL